MRALIPGKEEAGLQLVEQLHSGSEWGLQDPDKPVMTVVIKKKWASGKINASRWVVTGTEAQTN